MVNPKRLGNITQQQKEVMLEYLQRHSDLVKGKFSQNFSKAEAQKLWRALSLSLNALPGARKEWHQWRKTWHDLRTNTKQKKSAILKDRRKTGGGEEMKQSLSVIEEEVVNIMGPTVIEGHKDINESITDFDLSTSDGAEYITFMTDENYPEETKENDENYREKNIMEMKSDGTSTAVVCEAANVKGQLTSAQHAEINIQNNVDIGTPSSSTKQPRRAQRLLKTITATETLAKQNDEKLKLLNFYYRGKLELYKQDIEVKKQISNSLKIICEKLNI